MRRGIALAALAWISAASAVTAQEPVWRFQWQTGQALTYRVEQATAVTEVVEGKTATSATKLRTTKRWQVIGVDRDGNGTLQLTLTALRLETTTPSGEVLCFDSAAPDKSNPAMREQLARYVGTALGTLRVTSRGEVAEAKDLKFGTASRYESEPPFVLTLPASPQSQWERTYSMTLEPPEGTGQKYAAIQKYVCDKLDRDLAAIQLTTSLKEQPPAKADQLPLLQLQPEGEVVFDVQAGRLQSARLHIDREVKGHQGEGSSYRFQSTYAQDFVAGQ